MRFRLGAVLACASVLSLAASVASAAPGYASARSMVPGTISTVAGGVGGPGLATKVDVEACGVVFGNGQLYVADDGTVRQVNPATGQLTTIAGNDSVAPQGDGGPATQAAVFGCELAVDHQRNLLLVQNSAIRVVAASTGTFYGQPMTAGDIYTVANPGDPNVSGIAVDPGGNLLLAESDYGRVQVLAESSGTFYGQAMTAGHLYTVAGGGAPHGDGDGGPATEARIREPQSVAVDRNGNLLITDYLERIRVVAVKTGTFYGQAMTAGDIYTVAGIGKRGYSGDGGLATKQRISLPSDVVADRAGNLVISDTGNYRVRIVAVRTGRFYGRTMKAGHIYTVAGNYTSDFTGSGGLATRTGLGQTGTVTVDGSGNLVITADQRVLVLAVRSGRFYGRKMTAGHIYAVTGGDTALGDGGPATRATIGLPTAVTVTGPGNVVLADVPDNRIRMVAAKTGRFFGQAMKAGDVYTVAGNGKVGFSGDGGLATRARLDLVLDVSADGAGNLLIVDSDNNRIRVVAARTGRFYGRTMTTGHIYTVAGDGETGASGHGGLATKASLGNPAGVTTDANGNLVIIATYRVKVVAVRTGTFYGQAMKAGHIYNVAGTGKAGSSGDGGPALDARLGVTSAIATDSAGNLVVCAADRIRVVAVRTGTFYGQAMTAGDIYTVAGGGPDGRDGVPATSASIHPSSVAVDAGGNLVIADPGANKVRLVAVTTGTFYGQSMTAGDIYTVAGNGTDGFSGDGGPATAADLDFPDGVALDRSGDVLIAAGVRIRLVAS